ncbi:MAG: class I SAM-dependent methyltransferase [Gemmatimonadetes bacterium]|nr:class I SAM-dependent methyltransferase [Gemmatimonadota bacterium]
MLFSAPTVERPSSWFTWHAALIGPGTRVLDLACGAGRHAIAAAELGARVTAVDSDAGRLRHARRAAQHRRLSVEWIEADLAHHPVPERGFDLVMIFNYLDRRRMPDFTSAVARGGYLMVETFLESQRQLGWGPTSGDHLLRSGELPALFAPLEMIAAREALDFFDGRPMAIASALAQRIGE